MLGSTVGRLCKDVLRIWHNFYFSRGLRSKVGEGNLKKHSLLPGVRALRRGADGPVAHARVRCKGFVPKHDGVVPEEWQAKRATVADWAVAVSDPRAGAAEARLTGRGLPFEEHQRARTTSQWPHWKDRAPQI